MATTKITNLSAVSAAIAILNGQSETDVLAGLDVTHAELIEKLEKVAAGFQRKPVSKAGQPTKAAIENAELARQLVAILKSKGLNTCDSRYVVENVPGILSTQKATSVMRVAVEKGLFTKARDKKNKLVYTLVD